MLGLIHDDLIHVCLIWLALVPIAFFSLAAIFRMIDLWPNKTRKGSRGT